jgi:hypothetical protein
VRIYVLLMAFIALTGCGDRPSREAPRAGNKPSVAATPGLPKAPSATCGAAMRWWRAAITPSDSGRVTAVDTILVPPLGDHPAAVCQVRVWLPHGMREGQPAWGGGDDVVPLALQSAGADWRRLIEYDADGPDGNLSGYQREEVRCTVAQSWDGGDDGDSTYVAEVWYRQELTCWVGPSDGEHANSLRRSAPS